jgi:hypothetical protein
MLENLALFPAIALRHFLLILASAEARPGAQNLPMLALRQFCEGITHPLPLFEDNRSGMGLSRAGPNPDSRELLKLARRSPLSFFRDGRPGR